MLNEGIPKKKLKKLIERYSWMSNTKKCEEKVHGFGNIITVNTNGLMYPMYPIKNMYILEVR